MALIPRPKENWRGKLELEQKHWDALLELIAQCRRQGEVSDMLDEKQEEITKNKKTLIELKRALVNSGVIIESYHSCFGKPRKHFEVVSKEKVTSLSEKIDLLLDHLGLEYTPERNCGPSLEPKDKEEE